MKTLAILVMAGLLLANGGGCFGGGERVTLVPTPVPCIRAGQVPAETPPLGTIPNDARQAADAIAAKLLEVRGENRILRGLISACIATN
jgi:hypothetical protein